jgi:hypothetical protein
VSWDRDVCEPVTGCKPHIQPLTQALELTNCGLILCLKFLSVFNCACLQPELCDVNGLDCTNVLLHTNDISVNFLNIKIEIWNQGPSLTRLLARP